MMSRTVGPSPLSHRKRLQIQTESSEQKCIFFLPLLQGEIEVRKETLGILLSRVCDRIGRYFQRGHRVIVHSEARIRIKKNFWTLVGTKGGLDTPWIAGLSTRPPYGRRETDWEAACVELVGNTFSMCSEAFPSPGGEAGSPVDKGSQ